jgi:hypothetical protein
MDWLSEGAVARRVPHGEPHPFLALGIEGDSVLTLPNGRWSVAEMTSRPTLVPWPQTASAEQERSKDLRDKCDRSSYKCSSTTSLPAKAGSPDFNEQELLRLREG